MARRRAPAFLLALTTFASPLWLAGCASLLLLAGCASTTPLMLPAVGPSAVRVDTNPPTDGILVVYSDTVTEARHRTPPVYAHSGYVVRTNKGKLVARVDNNVSEVEAEPEKLSLAPGLYEVQARATNVGTVIVPVVVAPGQRTDVFLDARGMPEKAAAGLTDPVKLADGRVVGPRAASSP